GRHPFTATGDQDRFQFGASNLRGLPEHRSHETPVSLFWLVFAWASIALPAIHSVAVGTSLAEYVAFRSRFVRQPHQWILCPGCYCLRNRSDFFHSNRRDALRSASYLVADFRCLARWRFAW